MEKKLGNTIQWWADLISLAQKLPAPYFRRRIWRTRWGKRAYNASASGHGDKIEGLPGTGFEERWVSAKILPFGPNLERSSFTFGIWKAIRSDRQDHHLNFVDPARSESIAELMSIMIGSLQADHQITAQRERDYACISKYDLIGDFADQIVEKKRFYQWLCRSDCQSWLGCWSNMTILELDR